ncbi:MAG: serine/threonine protein kinase, partial [Deltaproteobacteria bacterium]|nr:serine/threonine protein kinase [Deltaproteobacteria bacterium]
MEAPRAFGKYSLIRLLSEGGMGRVYLAHLKGPASISKEVALKMVRMDLAQQEDFVQLFLEEARVAMKLSHRNIVQTFDAGREGEHYYLVMELMNGGSLAALASQQQLPPDVILFIGKEIAAALEYAHGQKGVASGAVVHRDVSLANILFSTLGDVKLTDFGVAKVMGRTGQSVAAGIKGKLGYMAPEQARGETSPRSDIFALGAVLFRLITGHPLRANPSLEAIRSGLDLPHSHLDAVHGLSDALRGTVEEMLRTDPARRPTAKSLRERLALQLDLCDTGHDPHARLQSFITQQEQGVAPEADPPASAQKMANAIMQMAMEVPTDAKIAPPPAPAPTTTTAPEPEVNSSVAIGPRPTEEVPTTVLPKDAAKKPRGHFIWALAGASVIAFLMVLLMPSASETPRGVVKDAGLTSET